jgi:hypothetical protein
MGMAGAVFQSLTRNPLGSPDITGFGNGASAGALVAIILFDAGAPQTALGAVCGGFATAVAVYLLAWKQGVHGYRLILVGIGASAVLGSATSFLYVRADIGKAAQAASWLIGSLNSRGWSDVWTVGTGLAVLVPVVIGYGRRLTLLELGRHGRRPRRTARAQPARPAVRGNGPDRDGRRRRRAHPVRGHGGTSTGAPRDPIHRPERPARRLDRRSARLRRRPRHPARHRLRTVAGRRGDGGGRGTVSRWLLRRERLSARL